MGKKIVSYYDFINKSIDTASSNGADICSIKLPIKHSRSWVNTLDKICEESMITHYLEYNTDYPNDIFAIIKIPPAWIKSGK